jgi:large subunit ribosomal protein L16
MTARSYSSSSIRMAIMQPRNTKYKKQFVGGSFDKGQGVVDFHERRYGVMELRSASAGRVTAKQIEATKAVIIKMIKKTGRLLFKIFPDTPISKKPIEVRMGKGKGAVDHWVAKVSSGVSICEIETELSAVGVKALQQAQFRLPIKTKIIYLH